MILNQSGIGLYKVLTIIFLLALAFVLYLPRVYDLNARAKTEQCIANMREVKTAVEQHIRERGNFLGVNGEEGTTTDLIRTKYLKIAFEECPEGAVGDKYRIIVDNETLAITIQCQNVEKYPDHILE